MTRPRRSPDPVVTSLVAVTLLIVCSVRGLVGGEPDDRPDPSMAVAVQPARADATMDARSARTPGLGGALEADADGAPATLAEPSGAARTPPRAYVLGARAGDAPAARSRAPDSIEPFAELEQLTGVRVDCVGERGGPTSLEPRGFDIDGGPASRTALAAFAPLLSGELLRYPPTVLEAAALERIVLCAGLRFEGRDVGGIGAAGWIYLDVSIGDAALRRSLVHHELFHLIDRERWTAEWDALNPAWFRYRGLAGENLPGGLDARALGFVSQYATASSSEDRAEVYAWMLVAPTAVAERVERDPLLARKVHTLLFLTWQVDAAFGELWEGAWPPR
jgi:hypothetical protein